MNYPILLGRQAIRSTCGRIAESNRAAAFWQSRMVRPNAPIPPLPDLADIEALARAIRATWGAA